MILMLTEFLGADGLMMLLPILTKGELPQEDLLEMIKRCHVPGYEQAHLHFDHAIDEGIFERNTDPGYYSQSDIQAVLEFVRDPKITSP